MRFVKFIFLPMVTALVACIGAPPPSPTPRPRPPQATLPSSNPITPIPRPASPSNARNWDEYRLRAAQRIVENNSPETFSGPLPERLQSIPVLQIQLNRDGSVRNISVLRTPKFVPRTIQLAMAAVRQAEPFGSVAHLPPPWQFNETFLYNDNLKFQLHTLAMQK